MILYLYEEEGSQKELDLWWMTMNDNKNVFIIIHIYQHCNRTGGADSLRYIIKKYPHVSSVNRDSFYNDKILQ